MDLCHLLGFSGDKLGYSQSGIISFPNPIELLVNSQLDRLGRHLPAPHDDDDPLCATLVKHHQDLSAGAKISRLINKSPLPTANLFSIPDGSRTPVSSRH